MIGPDRPLVLRAYLQDSQRYEASDAEGDEDSITSRIDRIDPTIVASFDGKTALAQAPRCCVRGMNFGFGTRRSRA